MKNEKIIIDAEDAPLGRVASYAAKQSLLGRSIIILNCNKAVVSGRRATTLSEYKQARARRSSSLKGPNFPRSPERIMKRTVRGMLSYTKRRGNAALKRIICHNESPAEYDESKKIKFPKILKAKITLRELSNIL